MAEELRQGNTGLKTQLPLHSAASKLSAAAMLQTRGWHNAIIMAPVQTSIAIAKNPSLRKQLIEPRAQTSNE
jgi:hypothetical protein